MPHTYPGVTRSTLVAVLMVALFVSSCTDARRMYRVEDGRFIPDKLPFSVSSLPDGWVDHPAPTPNCLMFFGRRNGQLVHIGVFVHDPAAVQSDMRLLSQALLRETGELKRVMLTPPTQTSAHPGYWFASSVSTFPTMLGSETAYEEQLIVQVETVALAFTFKRAIERDRLRAGERPSMSPDMTRDIDVFREFAFSLARLQR